MSTTLSGSPSKSTCRDCQHTIQLVEVEGRRVVLDAEMLSVVPVGTSEPVMARRVHAELCSTYKEQDAKRRLRDEMRDYNRKKRPF